MAAITTREPCRHLLDLPNDILLEIVDYINTVRDRLSFMMTCQSLRSLLLTEWETINQSMDSYPHSYIAISANKLRQALLTNEKAYNDFHYMVWHRRTRNMLIKLCKRFARATVSDLKELVKIERSILRPVREILWLYESKERQDYGKSAGLTPQQISKHIYNRALYTYWAYCDMFRHDIDSVNSGRRCRGEKQFDECWRYRFLSILTCPSAEVKKQSPGLTVQLRRMLENVVFKHSIQAEYPVAWQANGLALVLSKVLSHRGLLTLRIIAAQAPILDIDGSVNYAQFPADVADEIASVIATACAADWTTPPASDWKTIGPINWTIPAARSSILQPPLRPHWNCLEHDLEIAGETQSIRNEDVKDFGRDQAERIARRREREATVAGLRAQHDNHGDIDTSGLESMESECVFHSEIETS